MISAIVLAWVAALNAAPPELPEVPGELPEPPAEATPTEPAPAELDAEAPVQTPTDLSDEGTTPNTDEVPAPADADETAEEPSAGPPPAPPCECDELDWRCRQNAGPACNSAPRAPASPERAPLSRRDGGKVESLEREHDAPETSREPAPELAPRAPFISLGGGFGVCRQDACVSSPLLFVGRFSAGYRLPHVALAANGSFGGGPQSGSGGGVLMTQLDFGVDVFPIGGGRVDPYVSAGLGYLRVTELDSGSGSPGADVIDNGERLYSRPALRFGGGIPVRLDSGWSLGPRFDYAWGFLGSYCTRRGSCEPIASSWPSDPGARRSARNDLPKPWTVTIEARRRF